MARQPDIQYIRFATDGSAARKAEFLTPLKTIRLPKVKKQKQKRVTVHIDPFAFAGIVMAAVMMLLMVVGVVRLNAAQEQLDMMSGYVQSLNEENIQLRETFEEGCDLEQIERTALALGYVPQEQVEHITIQMPAPVVEQEQNGWERLYTFLVGLFA